MTEQTFKEIEFNDAKSFLNYLTPWNSDIDIQKYVFRGHSDDNYKLIPTAMRRGGNQPDIYNIARRAFRENAANYESIKKVIENNKILILHQIDVEYKVLRTFYKNANAHGLYVPKSKILAHSMEKESVHGLAVLRLYQSDAWMSKEIAEVATIAQHYGLPTRLLDWSYSPHVAAFFASNSTVKNRSKDSYISVWMLNIGALSEILDTNKSTVKFYNPHYQWNENALSQRGLFTYIENDIGSEHRKKHNKFLKDLSNDPSIINDPAYEDIFTERNEGLEKTILSEVSNYNKIKDEKSKLTDKALNELIIKIKINSKHATEINSLLRKMNITEATIFPGYSGVVEEMNFMSKRVKPKTLQNQKYVMIQ